jgi:spore germination cell wall hydrolase CwlJ-like protein
MTWKNVNDVNDAVVAAIRRGLDQWLLALTIFLEARGEPWEGQYAVAHVVMNRVNDPRRWGATVADVVFQPFQFSCFNAEFCSETFLKVYHEPKAFHDALNIASAVLRGEHEDNTFGANHYFATRITKPSWADDAKLTVTIHRHAFYKL